MEDYDRKEAVFDAAVPIGIDGVTIKPRTVERADRADACLNGSRREGSRVNGQIATFAVAGKIQIAGNGGCNVIQILNGRELGRHRRIIAEHAVFLPADEGGIGAAVADHDSDAGDGKGCCGKLDVAAFIYIVDLIQHKDVTKADTVCQSFHQMGTKFGKLVFKDQRGPFLISAFPEIPERKRS